MQLDNIFSDVTLFTRYSPDDRTEFLVAIHGHSQQQRGAGPESPRAPDSPRSGRPTPRLSAACCLYCSAYRRSQSAPTSRGTGSYKPRGASAAPMLPPFWCALTQWPSLRRSSGQRAPPWSISMICPPRSPPHRSSEPEWGPAPYQSFGQTSVANNRRLHFLQKQSARRPSGGAG